MRRGRITLTFTLAIAAAVVLTPAVAMAGGPVGRPMAGGGAAGVRGGVQPGGVRHQGPNVRHGGSGEAVIQAIQPGAPRNFVSVPSGRNVVTPGATVASWVFASPVVYAVPPVYDAPPAYDPGPPVYYPPPVSYTAPVENVVVYAPSPAPPPMPTIVEFSTGRYELRGDGITTAYVWVWIPNPPTAPPSLVPIPEDPPRASLQPLYRWTDEAGVAHWTDRRDAVPEQHRVEAELPRIP